MATGRATSEDGGIAHGGLLRRYTEAILDREQDVGAARDSLIEAMGEAAAIQAASIVASFDGINRVADATGIRLDEESARSGANELITELELEELGAARSSDREVGQPKAS